MLIEYKIKFEKDGVTITQRVEPNASNPRVESSVQGKPTFSKIVGDKVGDGFVDPTDTGGGGPGSCRVIALGPLIFCGSDGTSAAGGEKDLEKDKEVDKQHSATEKTKR